MIHEVLARLGISAVNSGVAGGEWIAEPHGGEIESVNPATGETLARVRTASRADYDHGIERAQVAFQRWRNVPPPQRGEWIRQLGNALRTAKSDLGMLVTFEAGKITSEGAGEVQEMIDMCDFATGLSRQLYGLTIASERPDHRLFEQWHPLGVTGVITAFNFPVAVWAWNAAIAAVCGDTTVWKPSPLTPLTAIAVHKIVQGVMAGSGHEDVFTLCIGQDKLAGQWLADDTRVPLISATGSCAMGRSVAQRVAARLGRSLLELGGNNAMIVTPSANLDLALRATLFAAAGTAGQRCTTLRRIFVHDSIADRFVERLCQAYRSIPIGNPWEAGVLMGPLISSEAVRRMLAVVEQAARAGAEIVCGGKRIDRPGNFVEPTIIRTPPDLALVADETFAPLLWVMTYHELEDAIAWNNSVTQGLSSAIFTDRVTEAELFLSARGSDSGIANVNIGTSGAEIGGAFGGEKDTGSGREAGSDAWKAYMRRQTCTVNYGSSLPLAQGVRFEL